MARLREIFGWRCIPKEMGGDGRGSLGLYSVNKVGPIRWALEVM